MSRIYVYPKFSTLGAFGFRTGGPGLGNLFFPYARALILAKAYGWTLINPSWPTIKIGPILRGERDARFYLRLFKSGGVAGPRKTLLLLTKRKIREEGLLTTESSIPDVVRPGSIVLTSGLRNYFKDIAHEREYIAHSFSRILSLEDISSLRAKGPYGIGVHVRLGDFQLNQRTPIEWYIKMIENIRADVGMDAPVSLASDGSDEELAELLRLPGVSRLGLNAVGDLFALSSCKVILASNSTFSAWAAFLGKVPIIWPSRGPELEGLFSDGTFEGVLKEGEELPLELAVLLKQKFNS